MKVLQKILFACVMAVGLSLTASAQNDQKKPPKDPPVVNPGNKPPPQNPPPDKPKKPNYAFVVVASRSFNELG